MKYEIHNGEASVGTAEWKAPGEVALDMSDPAQETWFSRYFSSEDSFMGGSVEAGEMACERPDSSPEAFERAAFRLAGHAYKVRAHGEARRMHFHNGRSAE